MGWLQLRLELGGCDPAVVEDALLAAGAIAVTLDDAGDDPIYEPGPEETPLWPATRFTALFPEDAEPALLRAVIVNALGEEPLPAHEFSTLDDRTWEREWLKDFAPMQYGERLWVIPGEHAPPESDALNLYLDPGLAFGTGTHATTALCLEWLDSFGSLAGQRVLDYGCGSGILAVAAALLGADEVIAVDIDPQALEATRVNAERNGVGNRIAMHSIAPTSQYQVIVANILAEPLVALAPRLRALAAPGARLALSGLIERQAEQVAAAYAEWCPLDGRAIRDGWIRLDGTAR